MKKSVPWSERYNEATKILNKKNNYICDVKNDELKRWLRLQMVIIKNGQKDDFGNYIYKNYKLDSEKAKKIKALNINYQEKSWDDHYNDFVNDIKNQKNKNINPELYRWITQNRTIYNSGIKQPDGSYMYEVKGQRIFLSKEKVDKLNKVNFNWKVRFTFEETVDLYEKFHNKYNRELMKNEIFEGINLYSKVIGIRTIKKNGIVNDNGDYEYNNQVLTKDCIKKLDSLNFVWDKNEYNFVTGKFDKNYKSRKMKKIKEKFEYLLEKYEKSTFDKKEDIEKINDLFYDSLGVDTPYQTNKVKVLK